MPAILSDHQNILSPDDCTDLAEVRRGVDAVDAAIVDLLSTRFSFMRAAARIKPDRESIRDEKRKSTVIANAVELGRVRGVPEHAMADLWERLVEASIAYELEAFDRR